MEDDSKLPAAAVANEEDERSEGDWSRQVNADETTIGALLLQDDSFRMESVVEEEDVVNEPARPPSQPKLSLKEKLVLRERQRRIETERARLKRQFALNNNAVNILSEASIEGEAAANGSVTDTLGGESIVAHADEDNESADQEKLGFNMERFLRNSDSFNPQLEPTDEMNPTEGGVVMERFLSEPVLVESDAAEEVEVVQRSVSFDVNERSSATEEETSAVPVSLHSFGDDISGSVDANASVQVQADEEDVAQPLTPIPSTNDHESTASEAGSSSTEPRVLGLTEADMQEMAAIEEASIGNAPPSEREEDILSEVGELAGFVGGHTAADMGGNFSQDTPTTAQESASMISGNQSAPAASASSSDHGQVVDQHSMDDEMPTPSSQLPVSPGVSANDTDMANPPSDTARDDIPAAEDLQPEQPTLEVDNLIGTLPDDSEDQRDNEGIVNRTLRPGMVKLKPPPRPAPAVEAEAVSPVPAPPAVVDGFDYDKEQMTPPRGGMDASDSYRNLPDDNWTPVGQMHVSPIQMVHRAPPTGEEPLRTQPYGSIEEGLRPSESPGIRRHSSLPKFLGVPTIEEKQPLIGDVPPEIFTNLRHQSDSNLPHDHRVSFRDAVESVFSTVRSEDDHEKEIEINESEAYKNSSVFERAFPERLFALTVTLIFEIPVLLMISGGSESLCQLMGRRRYHLLIGFLPLTSAISGNVGLQASTLTTRAISHFHVTQQSYMPWFLSEVGAAAYLGSGMGILLGSIAYYASGFDFAFGLTIFIAQFISIVTAGITGTFAPLLFSLIFKRDSGKWGGPLETAIQDIVGSFAMVVISYKILEFLGPGPIDPFDVCGSGDMGE